MKIWEVRDVSSDESFYPKAYFGTLEEAMKAVDEDEDLSGICEFEDELRKAAVIEHELGKWDHEAGFDKTVYERTYDVFGQEEN